MVKGLPDNVYTVLSISESHLNVYYVKSKGKKASVTKSKTKKTDTVINIANPNEQILSAKINNAK